MNSVEWYAASLGAALAIFFILRLLHNNLERCTYIRLRIAYRLLIRRRYWRRVYWLRVYWLRMYWASVTFAQAAIFGAFLAINIFLMISPNLRLRSGMLASVNMVPLFLGGRASVLVNFIGVPLHTYYLVHHWIGRLVVVQGLIHASLALRSEKQPSGVVVLILLALIFVTSFYFVRESAFQLFLNTHVVLALFTIGGLLWHLLPWDIIKICFPAAALVLWIVNTLIRIFRRRFLRGSVQILEIFRIYCSQSARVTAIRLTLPSQSLQFGPGSFYYIRFRKQRFLDRFQSHPIQVAWWDIEDKDTESAEYNEERGYHRAFKDSSGTEGEKRENTMSFLIQAQGSLSAKFAKPILPKYLYLDGPYGQDLRLGRFETVILVADGIGIAGILPYAQSLAERRYHDYWIKEKIAENKEYLKSELATLTNARKVYKADEYEAEFQTRFSRINGMREEIQRLGRKKLNRDLMRRVDLHWVLEENCQEQWIGNRLKKLQETDIQNRFQVWCYYPSEKQPGLSEGKAKPLFEIKKGWECLYVKSYELSRNIEKAIDDETRSPGRRIVVACGTAELTHNMRKAVLGKMSPHKLIEFAEVEFQPRHTSPLDWSYRKSKEIEGQNERRQLGDLQGSRARNHPETSKFSDSENEESIKVKLVPSKKPVISKSSPMTAQVCVITKSEGSNRFENQVNVNNAEFI